MIASPIFLISEQITEHFDKIFHNYLAAFRKGFGCQTTLLGLAEDWKKELDSQQYVDAVWMDLVQGLRLSSA